MSPGLDFIENLVREIERRMEGEYNYAPQSVLDNVVQYRLDLLAKKLADMAVEED